MVYLVTNVIDGDTFEVSPNWEWKGFSGNRVRVAGLYAPELHKPGGPAARDRLAMEILGRKVKLFPKGITYGRLLATYKVAEIIRRF